MYNIKNIYKKILDFVIPTTCIYCKKNILDAQSMCVDCFSKIRFIGDPSCKDCGAWIPYENSCCVSCLGVIGESKNYDAVYALLNYDEFSKKAILKLKHGDGTYIAKFFANIMHNRYKKIFDDADLIMYVPIHFKRLLSRKYNQSALIAKNISKMACKTISHGNLIRIKNTKPQNGSLKARYNNLQDAFTLKNDEQIKNKRVVLIDDVFTTGATLNECSKTIKNHGAKSVECICIARASYNFL